MKRSLLVAIAAGIDAVAAWVFYSNDARPIAFVLGAVAVIVAIYAFLLWRRGV